jgi:hypothetical protein
MNNRYVITLFGASVKRPISTFLLPVKKAAIIKAKSRESTYNDVKPTGS